MGWWKVRNGVVLGDDPADAMMGFLEKVRDECPDLTREEVWSRIERALAGEPVFEGALQEAWEVAREEILYAYADEFEGREPRMAEWQALVEFSWPEEETR